MDLLEQGTGGAEDRRTYAGRTMYPERLPSVALALDVTTRLLEDIERFFRTEAATVEEAPSPLPQAARRRLEAILARADEA